MSSTFFGYMPEGLARPHRNIYGPVRSLEHRVFSLPILPCPRYAAVAAARHEVSPPLAPLWRPSRCPGPPAPPRASSSRSPRSSSLNWSSSADSLSWTAVSRAGSCATACAFFCCSVDTWQTGAVNPCEALSGKQTRGFLEESFACCTSCLSAQNQQTEASVKEDDSWQRFKACQMRRFPLPRCSSAFIHVECFQSSPDTYNKM